MLQPVRAVRAVFVVIASMLVGLAAHAQVYPAKPLGRITVE